MLISLTSMQLGLSFNYKELSMMMRINDLRIINGRLKITIKNLNLLDIN